MANINFPQLERDILNFWEREKCFERLVEKNRGGQHSIDLEFQKHFEYSCFDAGGRTVQEKLIEERLYNE